MKLTIPERISLLNLAPQKGNFLTLQLAQEMTNKLNLNEEEIEQAQIVNLPDGRTKWNPQAANAIEKDFRFGEAMRSMIQAELTKLDTRKELTVSQIPLYEKFVLGKHSETAKKQKKKR
jgi:hypothetical protein